MPAQKRKNNEQSSSKKKRFDFRYLGAYFENNPSGVDDVASVQIGGNSSTEGQANSNVATYHRRGGIEEEAPDSDVETQPEKNGEDGNNAPSFAPLFEEKMHYIHKLERFALSRHITEFVLNANYHEHQGDQQFVTASDETLNATFEQLIDQAIKNAEQQSDGRHVSKIGIVLDGKGLNDPIVLPLRPPIQNNAHVLMMELEKIGQSDGDDQVHGGGMNKRSLLLSEAVQISITCLAPPVGSAPRFYPHQHWGYNEKQLIRIRNEDDNFCLFHALVAARAFLRIVVYDTETRLETLKEGQQRHKVNYLSARVTCTECCDSLATEILNCEICTNNTGLLERSKDWSEADGDDPIANFVEWILRAWDKKYKTYLWAHNASRFDGHFVLKYLGETKRRPDVIMNGLKLFEFRVQHTRKHSLLTWRDSCLLMPIALDGLKRTFNLDCDDKPFFPYAYNKKENYSVRLPHLPAKNNYCPGSMKHDKHQQFEKWYAQNVQNSFYLREELKKYCQNDTEILQKAIVEFRRILMTEVTDGYDVLPLSCTIASACMNIFRGIFMEEDQLALVPEAGYERNDRASVFAIKYLDWRSKTEGLQIQHAGNGREKQWKKYKLDGWIEEQNKCIEVLGCYWHGCERCFAPEDLLVDGKSCRELNVATYDRLLQIREPDDDGQCIEVEEVWECEINAQLTKNAEMKTFFDDLGNERGPIDPRAAYCGGRTGPLRLFAEPEADEKISVFDIVSLYPWVNYTTEYPVGIPQIIRPKHDEMFVNWTRPDDLKYRGIYRVRIVPPRGLRIPVLPVKIDERLLFCCCHHCASAFRKRATCVQHKCPHSDAQRAFTGNYTHIELERALESGYRVDRFWRAWHYEEWSDQIFKEYVRLLIKLKVQASGFPDGVTTDQQIMCFAAEYKRIYDVSLNVKQIKKNPGLRFITKLMLNSLWGKFSMRNELGANKVITRPQEFFKLVFDHKVEISSVIPLSDDAIRVLYKHKRNFVTEHSSSNIVLSLWTTSRARLKLLDYMQQIDRTEGAHLLYTDTDSVTVMHKKDLVPIKTGQYLGEMSEEYTNYDIRTFVCGGAKQYAFRMLDKLTGNEEFVQKIRGITFDVENSKALQFHHFRQQVLNYAKNNDDDSCGAPANIQEDEINCPAIFRYSKIQPMRESKVITRQQCKRYLPVCQKGIITNDLNVLRFGFE